MRRLVIVRHGNTFEADEAPRRIGRATDLPLVASGRAQATALGERFAREGRRFDRVLAGPLRRTAETARLVVAAMGGGPAIEPAEWLAEVDHGPDEGRPESEVVARIGRAALDRWDREGIAPDGWRVDAAARLAAWRACFAEATGATLLVTSNGAARFALLALRESAASGQPESAGAGSLKLRTGAYGEIALDPAPHLLAWDQR